MLSLKSGQFSCLFDSFFSSFHNMTSNRSPRYRLMSTNQTSCNNNAQPYRHKRDESSIARTKSRNRGPDKILMSDQGAYYACEKLDDKRISCCACDNHKCFPKGKYVHVDIKRKSHSKTCSSPIQKSLCDKGQQCRERKPETRCLHKSLQTDCTKGSYADKCLQANCFTEKPKSHNKDCQAGTTEEKPCTKGEVVQCELLQDYVKDECKKSTSIKNCQNERFRSKQRLEELREITSDCDHSFPFLSTSEGYLLIHPKMISYENENICMLAADPCEVRISHKEWCQDDKVITRMDHSQPYQSLKSLPSPSENCMNLNPFAKENRSAFMNHNINNSELFARNYPQDFHCPEKAGCGKVEGAIGKCYRPHQENLINSNANNCTRDQMNEDSEAHFYSNYSKSKSRNKSSKSRAHSGRRRVCFELPDSIDGPEMHIAVRTGARRINPAERNASVCETQMYECRDEDGDEHPFEECDKKSTRNPKTISNARRRYKCESDYREPANTSRQCPEMRYGSQASDEIISRARSEDCQNLHKIQKERGRCADQCRTKSYSYSTVNPEERNRKCILSNIPEESEGHTDEEVRMRQTFPNNQCKIRPEESFYWKARPEMSNKCTGSEGRPNETCSFQEVPPIVRSVGRQATLCKSTQGSKSPLNPRQEEDEQQNQKAPPSYSFLEDHEHEDNYKIPPVSNVASETELKPNKSNRIKNDSLFTLLDNEEDCDTPQNLARESLVSYGPLDIAAIVTIQKHVRGFLARVNLKKKNEAATKIQRAYRDHLARLSRKKSEGDFSRSQGRNVVKRTHSSDDTGSSMEEMPNLLQNLDTPKGALLMFGGLDPALPFNPTNNTGREVYMYMVDGNLWMHVGRMPQPRSHFGIAKMNNDAYIIGGTDPRYKSQSGRNLVVRSVWKVSLRYGLWVTDPDVPMDLPNPRSHFGCVSKDGFMYAIGGNDVNFRALDSCLKYDSLTNFWSPIADLDAPRVSMGITVFQDRIWIAGGLSKNDDMPVYKSVLSYDIPTNCWHRVENLPLPRAFCSLVVATDRYTRLYVVGGAGPRDKYTTKNKSSAEILVYNPEIPEWKLTGVLLNPRHGHAAAAIDDQIVILGGVISSRQNATKTIDIFDIPSSHVREGRKLHQRLSGMGVIPLM